MKRRGFLLGLGIAPSIINKVTAPITMGVYRDIPPRGVDFHTGSGEQFKITHVGSSVNYFSVNNSKPE